jgi:hypothetical protein
MLGPAASDINTVIPLKYTRKRREIKNGKLTAMLE